MPILEAPTPPRANGHMNGTSPSKRSPTQALYNGFTTSHSMQSIASCSTTAHENEMNGRSDPGIDDERMNMDQEEDGDEGFSEASEEEDDYPNVHVEVRLYPDTRISDHSRIVYWVKEHILSDVPEIFLGSYLSGWDKHQELGAHVEKVWIEEGDQRTVDTKQADLNIHVYQPKRHEYIEDFNNELEDYDDEDTVTAGSMRSLPSSELDGLWQTLIYSDNLKSRLLNFCYSTTFFSDQGVDSNIIAWNRVILLHGPPGTGKTSLCRALAQKIAIRMRPNYPQAKLIEINSHSLFSKWFSESGKLVQKLFDTITKEVDDDRQFVVVMIDEVESLTAARAAAMTGNEPSDSLRVVNALLTQLDRLRIRKNVLVMTTSNLLDAIDEAFLSRVDLSELVPLPPAEAVYSILKGCIDEMMIRDMIKKRNLLDYRRASDFSGMWEIRKDKIQKYSGGLAALADRCYELEISGRTLRKLPVLAHTNKLSSTSGKDRRRTLGDWIKAMLDIVERQYRNGKSTLAKEGPIKDVNVHSHNHSHSHTKSLSIDKSQVGMKIAMEGGKDWR
ncbi:uncharacterized protein L199_000812 [Kwoniella botswanensis]|uniref:uncharacterized protein n=1 Tax=Kwoniella botswanensis TaxID=1268659 RepID=UPI00315D083B